MLPLLVRLAHRETGVTREAGFRRSPVRIGRNHLNDLTIDDSFMSQWHGIVRFDDDTTRFIDVGSTNGTQRDGERIEAKEEIEIAPEDELVIGPLTITIARVALRDDQILSRRASSFSLGGTQQDTVGTTAAGTMVLRDSKADPPEEPSRAGAADVPVVGPPMVGGSSSPGKTGLLPGASPVPAIAQDGSGPTLMNVDPPLALQPEPVGNVAEQARQVRKMVTRLKPLHDAFVAAHDALEAAMGTTLDELGEGPDASVVQEELGRMMPLAFEPKSIRQRTGRETGGGGVDAEAWVGRLVPAGRPANWGTPEEAMERAGALLEAFAASYTDLRRGQRQVMTELSVEPGAEGSSLHVIDDPRELLYHLLDEKVSGSERVGEISRAFADIALHQIGMLNGAIDGARALLWKLSPHSIGAAARGALAPTSASLGDYLWPFKAAGSYYKFASAHAEVSSGSRMKAVVFGAAFAKAYYRVTGIR